MEFVGIGSVSLRFEDGNPLTQGGDNPHRAQLILRLELAKRRHQRFELCVGPLLLRVEPLIHGVEPPVHLLSHSVEPLVHLLIYSIESLVYLLLKSGHKNLQLAHVGRNQVLNTF